MRLITIEEHISCPEITAAYKKYTDPSLTSRRISGELVPGYQKLKEEPRLCDMQERLRFMEANGVSVQVLSYANALPTELPADQAAELCRAANNAMKRVIDSNPQRFAGFATLPLQNPQAAAKELERCVRELGFKGTMFDSCFNGHFFDEPAFLPVFAKAAELDVPVYLHPSFVDERISDYYYSSPNWGADVTGILAGPGFGWHLDVGMQLLKLVLSGLFDRYPTLKVISGHWGEVVVYYLERMDRLLPPEMTGLKRRLSEYFKENIYYTPGGMLSRAQMNYCIEQFGADHILCALDYPYVPLEGANRFFEESGLSREDKEMIMYGNAERLLKL